MLNKIKMAGEEEFTKSYKKSFMSNSPKPIPKQASILKFFGSQNQQTCSSPLSKNAQNDTPDNLLELKENNSSENCSFQLFNEPKPSDHSNKKLKKVSLSENLFNTNIKSYCNSSIVAPRILNEFNEVTGSNELDQSESSCGRYSWLIDLKDVNGRRKGDKDYDGRTLLIPDSAWNKFTPFEKQFWEIKCKFFDTVVFFKKGKFFELYENDADIGSKEFNLKMTDRVNMRMVGVPEATFDFWAAKFIGKGFKVAKVDQLENAVSKTMREKSDNAKTEKIIRRELTSILTCGTLVDGNHLKSHNSNYCVAFKISESSCSNEFIVGAAFVDASSAKFYMTDFEDDSSFVILATILAQISPKEIIIEKTYQHSFIVKLIKTQCSEASLIFQDPIKEFWDSVKTADELEVREYFIDKGAWPECLINNRTSGKNSFSAFGALISYLRILKLDHELLTYGDVSNYEIMKQASSMIIDGQVVDHLSVCSSSQDQRNTLLGLIDRCNTPFGHRRLRLWLLHPLYISEDIKCRQQSISCLVDNSDSMAEISRRLKSLPDLERLCTRIHAGSLSIKTFVTVLNGFKTIQELKLYLQSEENIMQAKQIEKIVCEIPDFSSELDFFFSGFNHIVAQRDGTIEMIPGSYPELDLAKLCISELETRFDKYLKEQEIRLKYKPLKYKDIGKEIYQIEMPISVNTPSEFMVLSKTKAVKRYWTPELRKMVNEYLEAKEVLASKQESAQAILYRRFSKNNDIWRTTINAISSLDCLFSLAAFSKSIPEPRCKPQIMDSIESTFSVENLRHPIVACFNPDEFVSNDIRLSSKLDNERVIILTGANMGGKSTLLRQVGLVAILSQVGAWVPASSLSMTPFDRIFTRLGANDNIIGGESTFKVELSETSKILKQSTSKSLVIMDELGRGTSTFDGVSIAEAVLHFLIEVKKSCVLFSTHYNMICDTFIHNKNVGLYYLNCLVNEEKKSVTFLYKLVRGVSPKSYGIHVAHMAGIPLEIINNAAKYSDKNSVKELSKCDSHLDSTSRLSLLIMKRLLLK